MSSSKEYAREVYWWRKQHHICVRCGKQDAYKDYTCCLQCRMDLRESAREHIEKEISAAQRAARNVRKRKIAAEKRANGICLQCSKPVFKDHAYCYEHYLSQRRAHQKYDANLRKNYREQGLCPRCGKPLLEGHKLCEEHYIMYRDRMLKINEERRIKNEYERNEKMAERGQ